MIFNEQLFVERLKALRKEKNLSQEQLAKAINVSRGAVGHWELGSRNPDLKTLSRIAEILDCSLSYMLGFSDVKKEVLSIPVFDMMANADIPMFIISCTNKNIARLVWVNNATLQTLGYEREEFLRLNPRELCDPNCFDNIGEKKYILEKKKKFESGWILITKDGKRLLTNQTVHKICTPTKSYFYVLSDYVSTI